MDLSKHVLLSEDAFAELSAAAWNRDPTPMSERVAGTMQATIVFAGIAGAFTAAAWGIAKAVDWYETRALARMRDEQPVDIPRP